MLRIFLRFRKNLRKFNAFLAMNSRHEKSIILVVFWDAVFRHEKESVLLHLFEKLAPREEFPPTLIFGVI